MINSIHLMQIARRRSFPLYKNGASIFSKMGGGACMYIYVGYTTISTARNENEVRGSERRENFQKGSKILGESTHHSPGLGISIEFGADITAMEGFTLLYYIGVCMRGKEKYITYCS